MYIFMRTTNCFLNYFFFRDARFLIQCNLITQYYMTFIQFIDTIFIVRFIFDLKASVLAITSSSVLNFFTASIILGSSIEYLNTIMNLKNWQIKKSSKILFHVENVHISVFLVSFLNAKRYNIHYYPN